MKTKILAAMGVMVAAAATVAVVVTGSSPNQLYRITQYVDGGYVEVLTQIPATGIRGRRDLLVKNYERMFRERVPLSPAALEKIFPTGVTKDQVPIT